MKALLALILLALVSLTPASAQFSSDFSSPGAAEQLRLGVQAYQRGRYAESLLILEKALAYESDSALIKYWLGRAYYKSGFEATALRVWEPLLQSPESPPFLRAKAELIRSSQSLGLVPGDYDFVEVARYEGRQGRTQLFLRPSAVLPMRDGSTLVVGHGSDELLTLDSAGVIQRRDRGGISGFDRPFGLTALPDGTLFLSEFNGDEVTRIRPDGTVRQFGSKGRGMGNFMGPQYLASDDAGYIYVSDYGNDRICKLDSDGTFILAFGGKQPDAGFDGLASPAGVVVRGGTVYVADSVRKAIYEFDPDGNYLGVMAEGKLHFPEGLSVWDGGASLLVADTDRIVSIDFSTETMKLVYAAPDRHARIVDAEPDHNGNVVYCDFDASAVAVISESSQLATGYDVEIERIVSDAFPTVEVDVSIRDRSGAPVVGLRSGNFYVTERLKRTTQSDQAGKTVLHEEEVIAPAADQTLVGVGQLVGESRTAILLERSAALANRGTELRAALDDLYTSLSAAGFDPPVLFTAGAVPALATGSDLAAAIRTALTPASGAGRFDAGLRLAATSLLPSGARDAVLYVGTGAVDESSFVGTTLSELAALLRNNGLRFYAVVLDSPSDSLRYLAERSGGAIYAASRPRGLSDLAADLATSPSGRYRLRFTAKADAGFGRSYLSVGVEAYLYKKSGKDELGYYAPLK